MSTMTSGTTVPRAFDFRGATAYAREELRVIASLHDALPSTMAAGLKAQLGADVEVEAPVVEMAAWHDYVRALSQVTILATIDLAPLPGRAVVEIDPRFAMALIERVLGGDGLLPPLRRPTRIEAALLVDLFTPVLEGIRASFAPLADLTPTVAALTFDPEFLDVAGPSDSVVVLGTVVTVRHANGMANGMVTICYPLDLLEPVIDTHPGLRAPVGIDEPGPLGDQLEDVLVDVAVSFTPTPMGASDLADLRPGDVLRLDHRVDQPVTGQVGGAAVFIGEPGRQGRRLSVRVTGTRAAAPSDPSAL